MHEACQVEFEVCADHGICTGNCGDVEISRSWLSSLHVPAASVLRGLCQVTRYTAPVLAHLVCNATHDNAEMRLKSLGSSAGKNRFVCDVFPEVFFGT